MPPKTRNSRSIKQTSQNIFIGVDGGGTKTQAVLLDENRQIISEAVSGASNPLRVGIEPALANIFTAIENACDSANRSRIYIAAIVCGLAGVRRQDLRHTIKQRISQNYRNKVVAVTTDSEIALYGVNFGKAGLVLIAGTGSVCLGKNDTGETATAGGWGPLAGDEGGGAGIARRALQSIAKASDGRGIKTVLSDYAVEYFRALSADDLTVAIYSPQMDNARIAGFARFVIKAAQQDNDKIAKAILTEAGFELGIAANAVIKKLKLNRKTFPVGYVGSIFKAGELITDSVSKTIQQTAPKAFLIEPELNPANAAAVMALNLFETIF
ncbi:MAG: BadF/BadG/BcrA/BcrD ATPase family protein [Pyrinomonadaceae bacterium]